MDAFIARHPCDPRVAKIVGFDTELMNLDPNRDDAGAFASRTLLKQIHGVPANNGFYCNQDNGRLFLKQSGASVYIDLDHLELAGPECRSALDFVRHFHGMLGIARQAARQANAGRATPLRVHANNSDGHGNSWGGHLSVMVSRTAYDWIFRQRLHYLLWLASAQASSIILTGAGKTGAENDHPAVPYQISQRADFFECLSSINTTRCRPLVNTRDEALAGADFARLHCIFHDTTLCHTSVLLRAGLMQVFLAMIEAETIDAGLCFEEPLSAVHAFSADPTLRTKARLVDGRQVTALEHQLLLRESAESLLGSDAESHVPLLPFVLETWGWLLDAFADNDRAYLSRHVDWVAKQAVIERAVAARSLDFSAPSMKALDFAWSDLNKNNGIYFALEKAGVVGTLVSADEIARAAGEAPSDTRAYPRSRLLRAFSGRRNARFNWDCAGVELRNGKRLVVRLPDPGAGLQVYGDLDGLTELELLKRLNVTVEPEVWHWKVASPATTHHHWKGSNNE